MTGARSDPPVLPGFTHLRWLGGGGFADVFLYRQHKPEREVAVKVLRAAALDADALRRFDDEANLMARVSTHPNIVTVYTADIAADGRPYLVMEYYPRPHFGERSESGGLPVAEVLRVGIQVSGAVATAHAFDILHRDVKPANILVSAYDVPGLTDFGIAGATGTEVEGMTPQFTAPEVLSETSSGDVASDVYALGATVYALAAGRSPFELPGGDNRAQALIRRALNDPVPAIGRPDVPRSLEHLLAQALAKRPSQRPQSVAAFAASLRDVELELRLAPTTFDLGRAASAAAAPLPATATSEDDSARDGDHGDGDDGTRHRLQVVHPSPPPPSQVLRAGAQPVVIAARDDELRTVARARPAGQAAPGVIEAGRPTPGGAAAPPAPVEPTTPPVVDRVEPPRARSRPGGSRRSVVAGAAAVVILAVIAAVLSFVGDEPPVPPTTDTTESPLVIPPQPPTNVTIAETDAGFIVSFEVVGAEADDTYQVSAVGSEDVLGEGASSPIMLSGLASGKRPPCLKVSAIRQSQVVDSADESCAQ